MRFLADQPLQPPLSLLYLLAVGAVQWVVFQAKRLGFDPEL